MLFIEYPNRHALATGSDRIEINIVDGDDQVGKVLIRNLIDGLLIRVERIDEAATGGVKLEVV